MCPINVAMALMARWQPGARSGSSSRPSTCSPSRGTTPPRRADRRARRGHQETFFRHFPDKRELLVAGQETLSRLLADGIAEAPASASPHEAVAAGHERASSAMGTMNRELGPRLKAAVAASTELQERDALKSVGLAAAMTAALVARGIPGPTAHLAAELGVLAFKRGYARWSDGDRDDDEGLAHHALAALETCARQPRRWADRRTRPVWPTHTSTPLSEHDSSICSTSSVPTHRRSSRRGRPAISPRTSSCASTIHLAGPGLVLPGTWGRFAERRRSALASSDFSWLVATIRAGPPPGFFRIEWVRRFPNLNEFFVHHEDVRRADGRGPRTNEQAMDYALWRNVSHGCWFLARRLRGAGLALQWTGTAHTVRARRGDPTARLVGPPGELLLYLFGRHDAARVEVVGPAAAREAVRRARFGM